MTKAQAIDAFGSQMALAAALGITSAAISQWPDVLDQAREDRVRGAMLRLGMVTPYIKTGTAGRFNEIAS